LDNISIAYIGIGSNLGDRKRNIEDAMCLLNNSDVITIKKISSIYETKPAGGPPQNDYLNGVFEIETHLSPYGLLREIHAVENKLGRVRTKKNGPRTIDLDILLFDNIFIQDDVLYIPHPRMAEREFVMRGLCEIAPHLNICHHYCSMAA